MIAFLLACHDAPEHGPELEQSAGAIVADDTAASSDDTAPVTKDTAAPPPLGLLVAIGGGTEGDIGDATAWSDGVYRAMLEKGDVTGDGILRVAVLSTSEQTGWIPEYFRSLGADEAFNVVVATHEDAESPIVGDRLAESDVLFLKGGDQGEYYDKWHKTLVSDAVQEVFDRGGCIAGTSAGAMSLSEWALAGAGDYESDTVLRDGATGELDDVTNGGSSLHHDFLALLPGTVIDSHFSTRARLGRLAGVLARLIDDGGPSTVVGVGIDEQTAIVVDGPVARVMGVGSVTFLQRGTEEAVRTPGLPLVWADLRVDRLTDGWSYDLATRTPIDSEVGEAVTWDGELAPQTSGPWSARGDHRSDENAFGSVIERWPASYAVRAGTAKLRLENAIGLLDAQSDTLAGVNDEVAFRALYDHLGTLVFLVGAEGSLDRSDDVITLGGNGGSAMATMILDASGATARSLSPSVSPEDAGDGALHAAGLVGVRLDILFTGTDGRVYDPALRRPVVP